MVHIIAMPLVLVLIKQVVYVQYIINYNNVILDIALIAPTKVFSTQNYNLLKQSYAWTLKYWPNTPTIKMDKAQHS